MGVLYYTPPVATHEGGKFPVETYNPGDEPPSHVVWWCWGLEPHTLKVAGMCGTSSVAAGQQEVGWRGEGRRPEPLGTTVDQTVGWWASSTWSLEGGLAAGLAGRRAASGRAGRHKRLAAASQGHLAVPCCTPRHHTHGKGGALGGGGKGNRSAGVACHMAGRVAWLFGPPAMLRGPQAHAHVHTAEA